MVMIVTPFRWVSMVARLWEVVSDQRGQLMADR